MKNRPLWCTLLIALVTSASYPHPSNASPERTRTVAVSESRVLAEVAERRRKNPTIAWTELARYGNELLEKRGFDYMFDVCDILGRRKRSLTTESIPARYQVSLTTGEKLMLRLNVLGPENAACGECLSMIPSLKVTAHDLLLLANDKGYRVRRPKSFALDEAHLVDATMKKVLRTWQLPYQAIPVGISDDGTKLYLDFYTEYELEGLVLEVSEVGTLKFRDRGERVTRCRRIFGELS